MSFDEVQFPVDISRGATARSRRITDIVVLRSGFEERNTIWANSRRIYNAAYGVRDLNDIYAIQEFWEGRRGRLRGFRFKDWSDYRSGPPRTAISNTDQAMSQITATTFQLQKRYDVATNPWTRIINKPVNDGSITIRDDTGNLNEGPDYSVDYTTGIVTFSAVPTGTPTAGFEFDVPVRFEADEIEISVEIVDAGQVPDINVVEIRV